MAVQGRIVKYYQKYVLPLSVNFSSTLHRLSTSSSSPSISSLPLSLSSASLSPASSLRSSSLVPTPKRERKRYQYFDDFVDEKGFQHVHPTLYYLSILPSISYISYSSDYNKKNNICRYIRFLNISQKMISLASFSSPTVWSHPRESAYLLRVLSSMTPLSTFFPQQLSTFTSLSPRLASSSLPCLSFSSSSACLSSASVSYSTSSESSLSTESVTTAKKSFFSFFPLLFPSKKTSSANLPSPSSFSPKETKKETPLSSASSPTLSLAQDTSSDDAKTRSTSPTFLSSTSSTKSSLWFSLRKKQPDSTTPTTNLSSESSKKKSSFFPKIKGFVAGFTMSMSISFLYIYEELKKYINSTNFRIEDVAQRITIIENRIDNLVKQK